MRTIVTRRLPLISKTPLLWSTFVWPLYDQTEEHCVKDVPCWKLFTVGTFRLVVYRMLVMSVNSVSTEELPVWFWTLDLNIPCNEIL